MLTFLPSVLSYPVQVLQYFASADTAPLLNFLGAPVQLCKQNFAGGDPKGVWFRQLPAIS